MKICDTQLIPEAEWTPDCQGKWDYDCRIISLSTRYWGAGGSFTIYDRSTGKIETSEDRPEIKPSANASIVIWTGAEGRYVDLCSQDFEADTEAEVKSQVEAWAATMYKDVALKMAEHFSMEVDLT